MNRLLLVPAVVCLLAFVSLYAVLNRAAGVEGDATKILADAPSAATPLGTSLVSVNEAERVLGSLRDKYLQRCRDWDNSPHRSMSRIAQRRYTPSCAEVVMSPKSTGERDSILLATISMQWQKQSQTKIPCVVDSTTKQVRLFHEGQWLSGDEWLNTLPLMPNETNRKAQ